MQSQSSKPILICCGILEKEIRFLAAKNRWEVDLAFLPSALHIDFDRLKNSLEECIKHYIGRKPIIFYGVCHPLMDRIVSDAKACRTPGQNCVDIYLGNENFCRELENGAFFLFEDWALHWEKIVGLTMPGNPKIMRSIFQGAHKYLLAIRTPCSHDFSTEAKNVSNRTGLELRWIECELDALEKNLQNTIYSAIGE